MLFAHVRVQPQRAWNMDYPEEKHNGQHRECRCGKNVMRMREQNEQQTKHEG